MMPRYSLTIFIVSFFLMAAAYGGAEDELEGAQGADPNLLTFSKIDKAQGYSTGENTKVAILDWLFDMSPEAASKYVNPISLVPGQPIGFADPWHGEWMAELVHKIAPDAKIIPIRARPSCDKKDRTLCDKQAYEEYLIKGIRHAADQGAVAVTSSMGPLRQSAELRDAVRYAEERGTIFVDVHPEYVEVTEKGRVYCKQGQCDDRIIHTGLVSVPAYPVEVEPARDIFVWPYSPEPQYKDGWGYSNGPPTVAGVIALMKSANQALRPAEIREIIKETAADVEGFRVLDAEAAVKEALRRTGIRH